MQRHHACGPDRTVGQRRVRSQHGGCGTEKSDGRECGNHPMLHGNLRSPAHRFVGGTGGEVQRWRPQVALQFAQIECPVRVCAVQRRRFPVGASPTRQPLQPEAIGAVMEVTKWLKPSISVSRIGDSASVQAATRVNAEQSSKRTMRRSTRQPYRGRLIRLDEMSEAIRSDAAPG